VGTESMGQLSNKQVQVLCIWMNNLRSLIDVIEPTAVSLCEYREILCKHTLKQKSWMLLPSSQAN
jgi:hypothetical protein